MKLILHVIWRVGAYPLICAIAYSDWVAGKLEGYWFFVVIWFSLCIVVDEVIEIDRERSKA